MGSMGSLDTAGPEAAPGKPSVLTRLWRAYLSRQFVIFLAFGGSAAAVNLAVGTALYDHGFAALPYWVSVLIAATCGLVVNFMLNHLFNFRFRQRSTWEQFRTFTLVAAIGTALTALIADGVLALIGAAGVDSLALPFGRTLSARFLAHFCAVALVTFYSYAAHRYFSFNVGFRVRLRRLAGRLSLSGR